MRDGLRRLHMAGVDVLLDDDSTAHLIEANDRPLFGNGVIGADVGEAEPPPCQMAVDLARHARTIGIGAVGIVLPEAFRVDGTGAAQTTLDSAWAVADGSGHVDDRRIDNVVRDLNLFCAAVVHQGLSALVMDTRVLNDPSPAGTAPMHRAVVWNRTMLPAVEFARSVNEPAAAALCLDKLASFRSWADLEEAIPTWRAGRPWGESASGRWVLKPRLGSGSRGLKRVAEPTTGADDTEDYVVQPWIEPATIVHNAHAYRFDLRVYVVGGAATTVLLRRCAAPASRRFDDSPLSWLTTNGPMHLAVGDATVEAPAIDDDGVAVVPKRRLDAARELAERAVGRIEQACAAMPTENTAPSFRLMHALSGRLDRVHLRQEPIR